MVKKLTVLIVGVTAGTIGLILLLSALAELMEAAELAAFTSAFGALLTGLGLWFTLRAARSLWAPVDRAEQALRAPFRTLLVMVVVAPFLVVGVWQHHVYRSDLARIDETRDRMEWQIAKGCAARANPVKLRRQIDQMTSLIERLAWVTPEGLDTDRVIGELKRCCAADGLILTVVSRDSTQREYYQELELQVLISGEPKRLAALEAEPESLAFCLGPRLVTPRRVETDGEELGLNLQLFAMEDFSGGATDVAKFLCNPEQWPEISCWLWPYRGWLEDARSDLPELCGELDELSEMFDLVERFEARRDYLDIKLDVLRHLTENGGYTTEKLPSFELREILKP